MKRKHHEYIIKAFINTPLPLELRQKAPELLIVDTIMGGCCSQVLKKETLDFNSTEIVSKKEKEKISQLINTVDDNKKEELIIYYRLLILTEIILLKYKQ